MPFWPGDNPGDVPSGRTINTTAPITGGGDLSADITLALTASSASVPGSMSAANFAKLNGPTTVAVAQASYSAVIDLATTGVYVLLPAIAARFRPIAFSWELESVGGTRSVAPTFSIGSNSASFDNAFASQAGAAGLLTQAAHTGGLAITQVSPNPLVDLTTSGLQLNVTAGMTGVAPVCTARVLFLYQLIPV